MGGIGYPLSRFGGDKQKRLEAMYREQDENAATLADMKKQMAEIEEREKTREMKFQKIEWQECPGYANGEKVTAELVYDRGETKVIFFATDCSSPTQMNRQWEWQWEVIENRVGFHKIVLAKGWARDRGEAENCAVSAFRCIAP